MPLLKPMSFGSILDANVLMMAGPRDTLLRAAEEDLYRPLWSDKILDEVHRNLLSILTKRGTPHAEGKAQYLLGELHGQFPEALVDGYEPLIAVMTNDENDRHVLAAAVAGQARVIVTENTRHFPPTSLRPYGLST